ncbi:MAG: hypothetical protein ACRBN8_20730 [Nannocystales bacterium]
MRAYVFGLAFCALTACGNSDEEQRNAPPVGSGGGPAGGSSPVLTGGTDTDPGGSDSVGTGLSMGPTSGGTGDASTGVGIYAVLTGRFEDGGGGYALPITCTVTFHRPGEINPSNGIESATTFSRPFLIDAFPQSFTIMNDEIGDVVVPDDPGYVTSQCDVDGDNFFDDNAGAYFPSLPMVEISIPASSIDLAVGPL